MSTHSPKRQKTSNSSSPSGAMEVDDTSPAAGGAAAAATAAGTATTTTASAHNYDDEYESLFPGAGTAATTSTTTTANGRRLAANTQTPQNDHLNAAAPGELSPPRSQAHDGGNSSAATAGAAGAAGTTAAPVSANGEHATDESKRAGDDVPGAGWKNKKAQEEKHRALEWLVDRDFSLEAFGDVVLLGKQQRGEE